MRIYFFNCLLLVFLSCSQKQQLVDDNSESSNKGVQAIIAAEKDTLKVGDTYKAKLFLSNNSILLEYNTKPKMAFTFSDSSIARSGFKDTRVISDTGYVEFKIKEDLKNSEKKYLTGFILINLPNRDTTFVARQEYIVIK